MKLPNQFQSYHGMKNLENCIFHILLNAKTRLKPGSHIVELYSRSCRNHR